MNGKSRVLGLMVLLSVFLMGCGGGAPQAANSQEAITAAKAKATVEDQVKYLVDQGNKFINSKEYDQAVNVAKYVLSNLDKESEPAKALLEKAKAQLQAAAQGAMDDAKKKLGTLGQ